MSLIVNAVVLGLSSVFGGVAGTRLFIDGAQVAAKTYFDSYYPQYADLNSPEAEIKWDAFRHTFVSGSLAM